LNRRRWKDRIRDPLPAKEDIQMANFVLVHGAWCGGWIWERCASLLRAEGHHVYMPTLTGLGERSHLISSSINLSTHIQDVLNLIKFEQLTDVVLCGHSYGGMIITAVADAIPEKIVSLVYLDAFLPSDGDSMASLTGPIMIDVVGSASEHGGLAMSPMPFELFSFNQSDIAMLTRLCTPQPVATFFEPVKLSGKYQLVRGKHYILATGWSHSPFEAFMMSVREDDAWTIETLPTGHAVMLDDPASVARLLALAA
jgi:pimeloyl-ACP methyl ester carboxylesterase